MNMKSNFESFKETFDKEFPDWYEFLEYKNPESSFECNLVEDLDKVSHDSYGYENSDLKRVYYIKDFDIYVMFTGNRSSYQGEEWYEYKEVKRQQKVISVWE